MQFEEVGKKLFQDSQLKFLGNLLLLIINLLKIYGEIYYY